MILQLENKENGYYNKKLLKQNFTQMQLFLKNLFNPFNVLMILEILFIKFSDSRFCYCLKATKQIIYSKQIMQNYRIFNYKVN